MKPETVMAIGCHNDDIELRCGGTLARLASEGNRVCYVLMRDIEQPEAVTILGATDSIELGYAGFWGREDEGGGCRDEAGGSAKLRPLHARAGILALEKDIAGLIADKRPDLILTHHIDDHHPDHYTLSRCVFRAARELAQEGIFQGRIWFWEPGGGSGNFAFEPDMAVDVTEWMEIKNAALKKYVRQLKIAPVLLQQIWKRGRRWGNLFGCEFAEPFKVTTAEQLQCRRRLHYDDTGWEEPESFERRFGVKCPDISWLEDGEDGSKAQER